MSAVADESVPVASPPAQDPAPGADNGYRVKGLVGKLPASDLSVGGGGELMTEGNSALLRGGGGGATGTLGTLSGTEVGELEGAAGLGIRGSQLGPSDAPSTVERQAAPEVAQRFANAPVAKPKPEPMQPAPEPSVIDGRAEPDKPRRARDVDAKEQLKSLLPTSGSKDRVDRLLDRLAETPNERDRRPEKKTSDKKKGKLELEAADATTALDFGVDEDDAEEEAWDETGATDIAKTPDESRHAGREGKSGKRDSGRYAVLATEKTPPATLEFLAERSRTIGLRFKSPDGYWANTYVPGDPGMRLLATRLARVDRTMLGNLRLDQAARQYGQPFDAPTSSALDVYLHADRAGIQGESRMLVQVGIKGTPRRSRSRPAMNVGVVLDLGDSPATEQQNAMRALVMALGEARDIGDRFSLVVAGRAGGLVVPADAFKHGPLTVAMQSLLANESTGETLSLRAATERAIGVVVGKDDPTTPLGSSVVLVVTPNRIDRYELAQLTDMAHESAVNGVPVSVVGVGANVSMEQLDTLTLAGQGNRRLLTSPSEAEGLVDRELSSVSRVIARAVRLRVRLAPGVKLIDVIGSHRLDEERAEQVRQAEQSIDRRMSKNLGVASDRGEDEDGIQIVIPSYYAGDTHVVLLDVVAPGPGPIADVRVRYKDLVYLKNGVSRANLTVNRSPLRAGPLEHNVLKNFLARNVSRALERAGDLLDAGDANSAEQLLNGQLELLVGLMQEIPSLAGDRDLAADILMLGEYSSILTSVAHGQPRDYVIDSLRYAAFLKVLPRPPEN